MPTYLILKRTGAGELDLEPVAVIRGKSAEEAESAIEEGATKGAGTYLALSINGKVERELRLRPELANPQET